MSEAIRIAREIANDKEVIKLLNEIDNKYKTTRNKPFEPKEIYNPKQNLKSLVDKKFNNEIKKLKELGYKGRDYFKIFNHFANPITKEFILPLSKEDLNFIAEEKSEDLLKTYHFDISNIERLLSISVKRDDIIKNLDTLLSRVKSSSLINKYGNIDKRKIKGNEKAKLTIRADFITRYVVEIEASIQYAILKALFSKLGRNRQRGLNLIIKNLTKLTNEEQKHIINIKNVLSSLKSKIDIFLVYDNVIKKHPTEKKTKLSESSTSINLFDFDMFLENSTKKD